MATFDDIYNAFLFVSSDSYGMNRALLCLDNGEIYFHSEMGDLDELDEDKFDCERSSAGAEPIAGSRTFWMIEGCCRSGTTLKTAENRKLCSSGAGKTESSFHPHKPFI